MPRLIGKKSNPAVYGILGLFIAAVGAIGLEYFGVINYIPNFGKESTSDTTKPPVQTNKLIN
jgi:hypothetical protein